MANRTDPQGPVEKSVLTKIHQSTYWKEECFGLTAETLVDKAMELDHIGGTFGGTRKPTPFMCLVMKMLEIQPEKDIVIEFIKNDNNTRMAQKVIGTIKTGKRISLRFLDHMVQCCLDCFGQEDMMNLWDVQIEQERMQFVVHVTKEPGQLVVTSLDKLCTRLVQKLIVTDKTGKHISLVQSPLECGFLDLIKDPNGNHVAQRSLDSCSAAKKMKYYRHGTTVIGLLHEEGAILVVDTRFTIEKGDEGDDVDPLEGGELAKLPIGHVGDEPKARKLFDHIVVAHEGNSGWWKKAMDANLVEDNDSNVMNVVQNFKNYIAKICERHEDRCFNVLIAGYKSDRVEMHYTDFYSSNDIRTVTLGHGTDIHGIRQERWTAMGSGRDVARAYLEERMLVRCDSIPFQTAYDIACTAMMKACIADPYTGNSFQVYNITRNECSLYNTERVIDVYRQKLNRYEVGRKALLLVLPARLGVTYDCLLSSFLEVSRIRSRIGPSHLLGHVGTFSVYRFKFVSEAAAQLAYNRVERQAPKREDLTEEERDEIPGNPFFLVEYNGERIAVYVQFPDVAMNLLMPIGDEEEVE